MQTTGMIRRVDNLGRSVIPKEIRANLKIYPGDPLEIFLDEQEGEAVGVSFRKYSAPDDIRKDIHRILRNLKAGFYDSLETEKYQSLIAALERAEQIVPPKRKE